MGVRVDFIIPIEHSELEDRLLNMNPELIKHDNLSTKIFGNGSKISCLRHKDYVQGDIRFAKGDVDQDIDFFMRYKHCPRIRINLRKLEVSELSYSEKGSDEMSVLPRYGTELTRLTHKELSQLFQKGTPLSFVKMELGIYFDLVRVLKRDRVLHKFGCQFVERLKDNDLPFYALRSKSGVTGGGNSFSSYYCIPYLMATNTPEEGYVCYRNVVPSLKVVPIEKTGIVIPETSRTLRAMFMKGVKEFRSYH